MKTQAQWFSEYAESHQNELNQKIHYICVPAIFFSIVGLIMCIPDPILSPHLSFLPAPFANWAFYILVGLMFFYSRLSSRTLGFMALFSLISLVINYLIGQYVSLFWFSLIVFIAAWIGQFYGHKVEGKKPSFLKDIQFLLIGPAWVFEKMRS